MVVARVAVGWDKVVSTAALVQVLGEWGHVVKVDREAEAVGFGAAVAVDEDANVSYRRDPIGWKNLNVPDGARIRWYTT